MKLKFNTLAVRTGEFSSILIHSKTLINLFAMLREHSVYETILEDMDGNVEELTDIEDFVTAYNQIEEAQFELRLYTNQSITY